MCLLAVPIYFSQTTTAERTSNFELSVRPTTEDLKLYSQRLRRRTTWCPTTCACRFPDNESLVIERCTFNPNDLESHVYPNLTSLQICHTNLSLVPCQMSSLTQLTNLYLNDNAIESVSCDLSMLNRLTKLDLSLNELKSFPCTLSNLTQLTHLDLSSNKIGLIQCELSNLTSLTFLDLSDNNLYTFSCELAILSQLKYLDLSLNVIDSLKCDLSRLTQLTFFDLSGNNLDTFPYELSNLTSLTYLNMTYNRLESMPCVLTHLTKLISLDLSHGYIESVSCDLSNLTQLSTLDLGDNELQAFPCELHTLIQLTSLDVSLNGMQSMNCNLSNLTSLKFINLSHNKLQSFPCELIMLAQLSTIDLSSNAIELIQCNQTSSVDINMLEKVDLSHNSILVLSIDALLTFKNLYTLYLDNNNLTRLPDNITSIGFKNINELRLGNNLWVCDCEILETRSWMKHHISSIKDKQSITCRSPLKTLDEYILRYNKDLFCSNTNYAMNQKIISGIVTGSVIGILCLFLLVTIITRRWLAKNRNKYKNFGDDDKEFDVFISYANEDEDYMQNSIVNELEKHNFKICFHQIHFLGGNTIIDNISQCINNSRRTLVIFSNYYKASRYCMWEFKEALNKDLREGTTCLVTIKDNNLDTHDLDDATKAYFQRHTYIKKDAAKFWESLLYCLPKGRDDIEELEVEVN